MENIIYSLYSSNPIYSKNKTWDYRTSTASSITAKERCIEMSKFEGRKWKIQKEQVLFICNERGEIENEADPMMQEPTVEQILEWRKKAERWDLLEEKISQCYDEDDEDSDLIIIGEMAAGAFGFL